MTQQPEPDVDTCVACGRPVQFYDAIGDGPGWWGHVHSADSLSRHRVVLAENEHPGGATDAENETLRAEVVRLGGYLLAMANLFRAMGDDGVADKIVAFVAAPAAPQDATDYAPQLR